MVTESSHGEAKPETPSPADPRCQVVGRTLEAMATCPLGLVLGGGSQEWRQATSWFLGDICGLCAEAAVGMEFGKRAGPQFS